MSVSSRKLVTSAFEAAIQCNPYQSSSAIFEHPICQRPTMNTFIRSYIYNEYIRYVHMAHWNWRAWCLYAPLFIRLRLQKNFYAIFNTIKSFLHCKVFQYLHKFVYHCIQRLQDIYLHWRYVFLRGNGRTRAATMLIIYDYLYRELFALFLFGHGDAFERKRVGGHRCSPPPFCCQTAGRHI